MENQGLIVSVFTVLYGGKKYVFTEPVEGNYTFDEEGFPIVHGIPFKEWSESEVNHDKK